MAKRETSSDSINLPPSPTPFESPLRQGYAARSTVPREVRILQALYGPSVAFARRVSVQFGCNRSRRRQA